MKPLALFLSFVLSPIVLAQSTLVVDLKPGGGLAASGLLFSGLLPLGDRVLLAGDDGIGPRLFVSDGTAAGTTLLHDTNPGGASYPKSFTPLGDLAVFYANDPQGGGLWRTDGTTAGTFKLTPPGVVLISNLTPFRGEVWFSVTGTTDSQLWRTDGTVAGTQLLMVIPSPASDPPQLFEFDDALLFPVRIRGAFGYYELWRTDGTVAGTAMLQQFAYGLAEPRGFTRFANAVFFTVDELGIGRELWRTDGTAAGTALFVDLTVGPASTRPENLQVLDSGLLLFTDFLGGFGPLRRLWVTDGTPAGTQILFASAIDQVLGVLSVGAKAYFSIGPQLGVTDGTVAGTTLFPLLVRPGVLADTAARLGNGEQIVFRGADWNSYLDSELWYADGTGPTLLVDVHPGSAGSLPRDFTRAGNRMFFIADDGATGQELHVLPIVAAGAWAAESFGRGCGVGAEPPVLSLQGQATLGQTVGIALDAASPSSAAFLMWSLARIAVPLGGGCTAYIGSLDLLASRVTDAAGGHVLPFAIPNLPSFLGLAVRFQDVVVAANAPLFGFAELSSGLELVFGP